MFTEDNEVAIRLIINECKKQGIIDHRMIAYILATAYHESKFKPCEEVASGRAYEGRLDLGNCKPGDGLKYKGRGYCQITGRANYATFSDLVGRDLVANPQLALNPAIAAFILVYGMRMGSFTGKKLSDYINLIKCDFFNARKIINGIDKAGLIAAYAEKWVQRLPEYLSVPERGGNATMRIVSDTFLKQEPVMARFLEKSRKVKVAADSSFVLLAWMREDQHYKVTLDAYINGYNTWYVFAPHVEIR